MKRATTPDNFHFYASSVAMWATTTDKRDLPALLELMTKDGYTYNLFRVPCAHDASYDIKMFMPQVEGTEWLGTFEIKRRSK